VVWLRSGVSPLCCTALLQRRGCVVGIIIATLSRAADIPRLTALGFSPNDDEDSDLIKATDASAVLGITPIPDYESISLSRGPSLGSQTSREESFRSLEGIVQQFGVAIPVDNWLRLCLAPYVMGLWGQGLCV
jgi:hypothetical protein